jgi:hypothetical protein
MYVCVLLFIKKRERERVNKKKEKKEKREKIYLVK